CSQCAGWSNIDVDSSLLWECNEGHQWYTNLECVPNGGVADNHPINVMGSSAHYQPHGREVFILQGLPDILKFPQLTNQLCSHWMQQQYVRCVFRVKIYLHEMQMDSWTDARLWTYQAAPVSGRHTAVTGQAGVYYEEWNFSTLEIRIKFQILKLITPSIRAVLKEPPFGKSSYISMVEKHSVASAERKGEGHSEKKSDMKFILNQEEVSYERVYAEFSYLVHQSRFIIHLYKRNKCKPANGKFGIIGIQVVGNGLKFNMFVRDEADLHRYYHLKSMEIPIQSTNEVVVTEFICNLLIFRNIVIINMGYIFHALPKKKICGSEKSSNVSTS
ncbi:15805_t:CDS:2, partial [Gigaspora margarita]